MAARNAIFMLVLGCLVFMICGLAVMIGLDVVAGAILIGSGVLSFSIGMVGVAISEALLSAGRNDEPGDSEEKSE